MEQYTHENKLPENVLRLDAPPKAYQQIDGWFDFEKIYWDFAASIAADKPTKRKFVEVGTYQGRSIAYLAELAKINKLPLDLYCVDIWPETTSELTGPGVDFKTFYRNMENAKVEKYVLPIHRKSTKAAELFRDKELHGVFLDGAHTYEAVSDDLDAWFPKLNPHAHLFAGHDVGWGEVRLALDHFCAARGLIYKIIGNSWQIDLRLRIDKICEY